MATEKQSGKIQKYRLKLLIYLSLFTNVLLFHLIIIINLIVYFFTSNKAPFYLSTNFGYSWTFPYTKPLSYTVNIFIHLYLFVFENKSNIWDTHATTFPPLCLPFYVCLVSSKYTASDLSLGSLEYQDENLLSGIYSISITILANQTIQTLCMYKTGCIYMYYLLALVICQCYPLIGYLEVYLCGFWRWIFKGYLTCPGYSLGPCQRFCVHRVQIDNIAGWN